MGNRRGRGEFYFLLGHWANRPPKSDSIRGSQPKQIALKCKGGWVNLGGRVAVVYVCLLSDTAGCWGNWQRDSVQGRGRKRLQPAGPPLLFSSLLPFSLALPLALSPPSGTPMFNNSTRLSSLFFFFFFLSYIHDFKWPVLEITFLLLDHVWFWNFSLHSFTLFIIFFNSWICLIPFYNSCFSELLLLFLYWFFILLSYIRVLL